MTHCVARLSLDAATLVAVRNPRCPAQVEHTRADFAEKRTPLEKFSGRIMDASSEKTAVLRRNCANDENVDSSFTIRPTSANPIFIPIDLPNGGDVATTTRRMAPSVALAVFSQPVSPLFESPIMPTTSVMERVSC